MPTSEVGDSTRTLASGLEAVLEPAPTPEPKLAATPPTPALEPVLESARSPEPADHTTEQDGRPADHTTEQDESAGLAPEPSEHPSPQPSATPGPLERGRIRRRARYLRHLREIQLRDIGGFMVELHRFEQERPELVRMKVQGAARTDAELRALERVLGERSMIRELREAGIGGACLQCGAVHGSDDNFCAACGEPLVDQSVATEWATTDQANELDSEHQPGPRASEPGAGGHP